MTLLTNSFEGGTNTTAISAANSGGASGNAFDAIDLTAPTFSSTHMAHGSLSAHAAGGLCGWTTSMGTQTTAWYRMYLYLAAAPGTNTDIIITETSAAATVGAIELTSASALALQYAGGTAHTMATTVPLSQWIRLEGFFTGSTTVGQLSLNIYLTMDSTTATESYTSAATLNTKGAMTTYYFGAISSSDPLWMDDLGLSSTGPLGPAFIPAAPPVLISYQQAVMTAATW